MRLEVAWTVDESRLVMTDLDEDQPLVTITFHEDWKKPFKRELLRELLKALERGPEECQHEWLSDEMAMRHCLRCGKQEKFTAAERGKGR